MKPIKSQLLKTAAAFKGLIIGHPIELVAIILFSSAWFFGPGPILSGDSGGFKNPDLATDWQRLAASLIGNSTRSWIVIFPFEIISDLRMIVLFQWIMWCIAFIALSRTAKAIFNSNGLLKLVSQLLVLVLFASPFYSNFNNHILGDSLTISLTAIGLSSITFLFVEKQRTPILAMIIGLSASFIRPHLLLIFVPLAYLIWKKLKDDQSAQTRSANIRRFLAPVLLTSFLVVGYWQANTDAWAKYLARETFSAVHTLSEYSPISKQLAQHISDRLPPPSCFPVTKGTPAIAEKANELIYSAGECSGANSWSKEYIGEYYKYLLTHPTDLAVFSAWALPRSLGASSNPAGTSLLPNAVFDFVLGSREGAYPGGQRGTGFANPTFFYQPLLGVFFIAVFLRIRARFAGQRFLDGTSKLMLIAGCALVGAIFGALLMPSTELEMARQGSAFSFAFKFLTLLILMHLLGSSKWGKKSEVSNNGP